ncbi:MAG: GDSL-type esterase/lipase family protein [Oscillospiraceae bacterium]|jgi:hypothetical protein|nr:GDSL-type esterase/lipase family protein [Oscillospiraceae bacterium]
MKKIIAAILCTALLVLPFGLLAQAAEPAAGKFLVLGDSIAQGVGAICPDNAYASRVAREKGYELRNFGMGGDTSAALLRKVREDETIRQAVREADIVDISIGGNDFYPSVSLVLNGLLGTGNGWNRAVPRCARIFPPSSRKSAV